MHSIQFKNKRSKTVLTLQWETPEDLLAWAESIKNSNGVEMVDPAIPVKLQGDTPPAPKLKVIAKKITKVKPKNANDIEIILLSVLDNLQEEFEALLCKGFVSEKTLDDKKNQIEVLNNVLDFVFALENSKDEMQFKLEACSFYHGVSFHEIQMFMSQSKEAIDYKVKEALLNKIIQIPLNIQPLIDKEKSSKNWDEHVNREMEKLCKQHGVDPKLILGENYVEFIEPKKEEIKIATKPVLGLKKIMEMSKNIRCTGK